MTEERSCKTCGLSSYNNVDEKGCGARGVSDCVHHSKWQPIQKAPSFQMTEEEAMSLLSLYCACSDRDKGIANTFDNWRRAKIIRKSSLVELVEEAEERYSRHVEYKGCVSDDEKNINIDKFYSVIQALKKDHPEFEGKK